MIELGILFAVVIAAVWFFSILTGILKLMFAVAIWCLIGYLAGQLIRGKGYGPVINAALGLGGGIVGNLVFSIFGLGFNGPFGIISGVVGAVILVYGYKLFKDDK